MMAQRTVSRVARPKERTHLIGALALLSSQVRAVPNAKPGKISCGSSDENAPVISLRGAVAPGADLRPADPARVGALLNWRQRQLVGHKKRLNMALRAMNSPSGAQPTVVSSCWRSVSQAFTRRPRSSTPAGCLLHGGGHKGLTCSRRG
jgi:hypothetical protein